MKILKTHSHDEPDTTHRTHSNIAKDVINPIHHWDRKYDLSATGGPKFEFDQFIFTSLDVLTSGLYFDI